jgi:hypothetical protein
MLSVDERQLLGYPYCLRLDGLPLQALVSLLAALWWFFSGSKYQAASQN